jgi:hypothetical protein
MATTLYPEQQSAVETMAAAALGLSETFTPAEFRTDRGASAKNVALATLAGTQTIKFGRSFVSNPLAADVTISGSITFNMRCAESNMSANAQAHVIIERMNAECEVASTVVASSFGTEMSVTTERADNWSASPTSTAFSKGDRIRATFYAANIGTMGSGSEVPPVVQQAIRSSRLPRI